MAKARGAGAVQVLKALGGRENGGQWGAVSPQLTALPAGVPTEQPVLSMSTEKAFHSPEWRIALKICRAPFDGCAEERGQMRPLRPPAGLLQGY